MIQIRSMFSEELTKELTELSGIKDFQKKHLNEVKYIAMLLKKMNFVKENCCEIGAGKEPILSNMILPEIQAFKKKVIVYDPHLACQEKPGMVIKKENFMMSTNIDDINTLYGIYSCKASIIMIEKAIRENKNLLLAFCSCHLGSKEHPMMRKGKYGAQEVCDEYMETYKEEFEFYNWPREFGMKPPIMVRKRKI